MPANASHARSRCACNTLASMVTRGSAMLCRKHHHAYPPARRQCVCERASRAHVDAGLDRAECHRTCSRHRIRSVGKDSGLSGGMAAVYVRPFFLSFLSSMHRLAMWVSALTGHLFLLRIGHMAFWYHWVVFQFIAHMPTAVLHPRSNCTQYAT